MKKLIHKITNSTEWEVLEELTKPKIILGALAFNVMAYVSMYAFLDLILFIYYDL
jgi:hypothetical protein